MKNSVELIVKGHVQGVGYRRKVKEIAIDLNIFGEVENLKNGDVRIIAEGEEKDIIEFIERIKVKDDELVRIKEVKEVKRKEYSGKEYFEIKYGTIQEELEGGFGAGTKYLNENLGISKETLRGVNASNQKLDNIDKKFDITLKKYDDISISIRESSEGIRKISSTSADIKKTADGIEKISSTFSEDNIKLMGKAVSDYSHFSDWMKIAVGALLAIFGTMVALVIAILIKL